MSDDLKVRLTLAMIAFAFVLWRYYGKTHWWLSGQKRESAKLDTAGSNPAQCSTVGKDSQS